MRRFVAPVLGLALLAGAARAENKGTVTEIDGLKSKVPDNWKKQEVSAPPRVFHFIIPKEKDDTHDAELVVFFFGVNQGGGLNQNVTRWKSMIVPPEGKKIDDVTKVDEIKAGQTKITVVDISGTYKFKMKPFDPEEKPQLRENYRLIGVIFESAKGPYFMRLVGPTKTVEANKKGLEEWLKNFK